MKKYVKYIFSALKVPDPWFKDYFEHHPGARAAKWKNDPETDQQWGQQTEI